ncbi:MAG TPA: GNAT family N-acetyltransferase [Gemmatimonadales bacterium]|nr:GNAT family N-acetyltransferase [Gemmatimonadales bacterium]
MSPVVEVTVRQLVLRRRPAPDRPLRAAPDGVRLRRVPDGEQAGVVREMYRRVGAAWHWLDRAHWTVGEWASFLLAKQAEVWLAESGGGAVGFVVLGTQEGDEVEICYFGLVPEWIGRGAGAWLLDRAIDRAWALGPDRLRLETCSLDAPAALPNYLARGFEVRREEQLSREVPDGPG